MKEAPAKAGAAGNNSSIKRSDGRAQKSSEVTTQFLSVFPLNPAKYGLLLDIVNGRKKATTKEQPPTAALVRTHLAGGNKDFKAIGYLPGSEHGTTVGMLDLDRKDYSDADLLTAVQQFEAAAGAAGIQILSEESLNRGQHCYLFTHEPVPFGIMRAALRVLAQRAGLTNFEPFPKGERHTSNWFYLPYAGALTLDGLGRTFLRTAEGEPVPLELLAETVEAKRVPAKLISELASQHQDSAGSAGSTQGLNGVKKFDHEAWTLLRAELLKHRPNERHEAAIAVLNVARRCGLPDQEAVEFLNSAPLRKAWGVDNDRTSEQWAAELKRWAKAPSRKHERGLPFLRQQGFSVPQLPETEEAWGQLETLPPVAAATPAMPPELVPGPLRDYVVDAAERQGAPLEFIAAPLVTAAASVIGRQIGIRPKQHDDWTEVPVLWCVLVASPSLGKSPAVGEALRPITRLVGEAKDEFEWGKISREARAETLRAEVKRLKKSLTRKNPDPTENVQPEIEKKLQELKTLEKAYEKRYLTNDSTVEKLAELLKQNPNGLLYHCDELMRWLRGFDRHGREGDRQFYLEAWSGRQGYSVDRIGRGSLHVEALAVSVIGTAQPGPMRAYVSAATEGGQGADGLLQRFGLLVAPTSRPPVRIVDRKPKTTAREQVNQLFHQLKNIDLVKLNAEVDLAEPGEVPALRLAADAQPVLLAWLENLHHRLRIPDLEETPAFASHLAKYQALVPRLALVFHLLDAADTDQAGPVSLQALELAIRWAEYLEQHARHVYAAELNGDALAGHALANLITKGKVKDGATVRSIYTAERLHLKTPGKVQAAVEYLTRFNYARLEEQGQGRRGRPSEVIRVHPELRHGA